MIPKLEIGSLCIECDNCRLVCPENAILKHLNTYAIEPWACTLCNLCVEACPVDCIKMTEEEEFG
ncbi:MAG: 4Fe-4S binding protein [Bacteriovoracaceae bacterium]|nr:4Fe-4S binding protein [Bacteriovoracaceae bacterium]